jgi:hypothetical protein
VHLQRQACRLWAGVNNDNCLTKLWRGALALAQIPFSRSARAATQRDTRIENFENFKSEELATERAISTRTKPQSAQVPVGC